MGFKEVSLEDVILTTVDNRGRSCPVTEKENEYLPLIATNCITERLYPEFIKVRSVDKETYENWFRGHPLPNDILFVNKGTPGKVAMVPAKVNFCIAQDMVALRIKPEYYAKYIFAVLRSEKVKQQIENMHVGTLIPHFKKGDFKSLKLQIVDDFEMQKLIGDFYFLLLEKIELNHSIIVNLENLCNSLFQRWFVNYEFPNQQGLPYRSSGGEMVESELGEIPKGWAASYISELGEIIGGGTPSKKQEEYYSEKGIPWITPKDLSTNKSKFIYKGIQDISELGLTKSSAKLMPKGTVLLSSRAPIGYIAIAGTDVTTNQGFKSIIPNKGYSEYFIYFKLKEMLPTIEANAGGSTFKEISGSGLKAIQIVLPSIDVVNSFNETVESSFKQIKFLEAQTENLISLRDSLFPKLLSGEITIPDESVVNLNE